MSDDPDAKLLPTSTEYDWKFIYERAVQHLMDVFVLPEIAQRQQTGGLPAQFGLTAAQVLFFPDTRPTIVRLDSEVMVVAKVVLREGVTKECGDVIYEHEIRSIDAIELTNEDDPDCGHMTLLRVQNRWFFGFDLIYNQALAGRHIDRAKEFILTAEFAASHNLLHAFVDAAFSAVELLAKSEELMHGSPDFRAKANHKAIASRYNRSAHSGNVESEHANVLNQLQRLRGPARYLEGNLELAPNDAQDLLRTVHSMVEAVERGAEAAGWLIGSNINLQFINAGR